MAETADTPTAPMPSPAALSALSQAEAVTAGVAPERVEDGKRIITLATVGFAVVVLIQLAFDLGIISWGFENWRPIAYAYVLWGIALGFGLVRMRGAAGHRSLFVLPAVLFTVAMVIFPTFFGLYIAFTDWNLSAFEGRRFSGLKNLYDLFNDAYYWNALGNMVFYVAAVLVQYAIAFGLALLLNSDIRARKFFRVAFLLPFMLSPVAVCWMIGKSLMEFRFGLLSSLMRYIGWGSSTFFTTPWIARLGIIALDP